MSRRVSPSELSEMHSQTNRIRNICILAHVDHGKTTLSDSLVCSNGVISNKLAGKLRYLDSTEEEQRRGITMHSSAISLIFDLEKGGDNQKKQNKQPEQQQNEPTKNVERYLINLVDSPGHLDFSSDVSTAARLCDGALIVIDVLEGICTQTHAVMFKALKERMRPCLVLNKIDRLLLDMKLTSVEAFYHLRRLVEKANALAYTLVNSEIRYYEENKDNPSLLSTLASSFNAEKLIEEWQLLPEKGNVVFASALDCWGFSIGKFVNIWATKLNLNKNTLQKYFFGDYALNVKEKKVIKYDPTENHSSSSSSSCMKPMFAAMVLDPIWQLYEAGVINNDPEKAAKMAQKIGVELLPREINSRDPRSTIQAIFRNWLSLSDAILRMVIRCMPPPIEAQLIRIHTLLDSKYSPENIMIKPETLEMTAAAAAAAADTSSTDHIKENLIKVEKAITKAYNDIQTCNTESSSEIVIFISKMMPVKIQELSAGDLERVKRQLICRKQQPLQSQQNENGNIESNTQENKMVKEDVLKDVEEVFVALGRVFCGTLTRQSNLYVINHRHDPLDNTALSSLSNRGIQVDGDIPEAYHSTVTRIPADSFGLYLCLGPSITPVEQVSAGNIVAIVGIDHIVLKTATIATSWCTPPLKAMTFQARPMVRVAVEPKSHIDLYKLETGLNQLYQFDPAVETGLDENGQHTLSCLGELHLEQCLKNLTERFAKCEIVSSEPLVAYRETIQFCDVTYKHILPPPWCDIPGLSEASAGKYRMLTSSGNIAITFSCQPLPKHIITLLTKHADSVWILSQLMTKHTWSYDYLYTLYTKYTQDHTSTSTIEIPWLSFLTEYMSLVLNERAENIQSTTEENDDSILNEEEIKNESTYMKLGRDRAADNNARSKQDILSLLLSFGSQHVLNNMLIMSSTLSLNLFSSSLSFDDSSSTSTTTTSSNNNTNIIGSLSVLSSTISSLQSDIFTQIWSRIQSAIISGFQECCMYGPMMHEPLHGVCFSIDSIDINIPTLLSHITLSIPPSEIISAFIPTYDNDNAANITTHINVIEKSDNNKSAVSLSSGQTISDVKNALRLCMLSCPLRIVEPMYMCDLQCDQSQLGNLYAVLSKRSGYVTKEDIIDGTSLFLLSAILPINESFGFAQELLRKTSGNATAPQLLFSHWNIVIENPFWRPTTIEEIEEYGALYSEQNTLRICIDRIRKRKGLPIEEKVVVSAEKQRNMNKKK